MRACEGGGGRERAMWEATGLSAEFCGLVERQLKGRGAFVSKNNTGSPRLAFLVR